ncbi:hypothetical protein L1987_45282 [Smallanthus sonchifolius]|uniref:Uncharacterized protein n=1 Tax=Smallanthus sonchifolius TaxID=185202 RepID=A0ACB9GSX6_9ASTR|nr:hypothetical protein L1987_45282 [Smallanthus sonchifolius]
MKELPESINRVVGSIMDEILISVSGHYCPVVFGGSPVIRSLTFKTNKRIFGPFGVEEGTPFNFLTNGGQIVGFVGRSGWFLDSLGFCLSSPKPNICGRFQIMFKGFNNPLAIKDGEDNKTKGSKGDAVRISSSISLLSNQ